MYKTNISFSKPKYEKISVDMHFHTIYSAGAATIDEVLGKIRKLGLGVSITDHNEIKGSIEAFEKKKEDDFLVPGIEVKSAEGIDILFYFYDLDIYKAFYRSEIEKNKQKLFYTTKTTIPLITLLSLSEKYPCLVSVAHPYGYRQRSGKQDIFIEHTKVLEQFTVFEAINGGNLRNQNILAVDYITGKKKGYTGGSDGHSIYTLGNVVTSSTAVTLKEFLDSIKKGKNSVTGVETSFGKLGELGRFSVHKVKNFFGK